jgi:hypothetical protein
MWTRKFPPREVFADQARPVPCQVVSAEDRSDAHMSAETRGKEAIAMAGEQHHGPGRRHDPERHRAGGRPAGMTPYPQTEEDAGGGEGSGKRWGKIIAIIVGIVLVVLVALVSHHAGR